MSLLICPECGKEISDKAEACPHCGLPAKHFTNTLKHNQRNQPGIKKVWENLTKIRRADGEERSHAILSGFDPKEFRNALISFDRDYEALFSTHEYIDTKNIALFKNNYEKYFKLLDNKLIFQYLITNATALQIDEISLNRFYNKMQHVTQEVEQFNNSYVDKKLVELKDYFDHIMDNIDPNIKLDEEQRRAVITDDNHCLLVAGAGAGKTTTMAAKVKYLVEKQKVNPKDIIVISYTNKAVNELKDRINKSLKIPAKISTFHAFAFEVVKKANENPPDINISSYNIVDDMLVNLIFENKRLMRNLVLFMGYYFDLPEEIFNFKSLNEYHLYKSAIDYETLKSGLGEYVQKVSTQRGRANRTITGEFLRSTQEVQIANFLYLNGIDYVYEKPYPFPMLRSTKKYTPDFFISQGENEAYIEHYGLTENLKSFVFTPQQIAKYQKSIGDKRTLHKVNGTKLLETWSFFNDKRPLFEHLHEILVKNGFVMKPRNLEEVYKKIVDTGRDKYIYKMVWFTINFIEQFKTSGYDDGGFSILRAKTDNVRTRLYLDIVEEVYKYYQVKLKELNQIDFADMINEANFLLSEMEKQNTSLPYKYIIIDEFQDIARQRFNLTKRLSDITHAKVVAVGDDWQSIYAFAGSDITLFTKFIEFMGSGKELKITHTYRNSQELIDIAGGFVQKNSSQIRKHLLSPKHLKDPIQLEFYDDNNKTYINLAASVNSAIGRILDEFGPKKSILLLGRYNFDKYKLIMTKEYSDGYNDRLVSKQYPNANLTFMTAHSSKGLGYDNVIIVNMLENRFGFPSQIEQDPIIKMVTYEDTSVPFAEERRLFYVALTRTKNRVYIAVPKFKPSRFIVELIRDYGLPYVDDMNLGIVDLFNLKCPKCNFPLKYEFNKNYGLGAYFGEIGHLFGLKTAGCPGKSATPI
jgi:DNA helicase-4